MDVNQYLNYLIAEIYSANADWPGNNLKLWRPRTPDGRWRWMLFDTDFGFGGNADGQADQQHAGARDRPQRHRLAEPAVVDAPVPQAADERRLPPRLYPAPGGPHVHDVRARRASSA